MILNFKKYQTYTNICNKIHLVFDSTLDSDLFQLHNKWYIKLNIDNCKADIADIDNQCNMYAQRNNLHYKSCIFENSILVKIPYRYKKFEAICENATFYDLQKGYSTHVDISPISISEYKEGTHTCCFKLTQIRLNLPKKHPHAPLVNEEDAEVL